MNPPTVVIAGGGTGGHVTPALAIAEALVAAGRAPEEILFVGSTRGIERRLVPEAGFAIVLLPGRGVERRLSLQAVGAVLQIMAGVVRGFWLMLRSRPRVVVSVGGFASVPCAAAAVALRIPLVVAEQNAVPSAANRLFGRFARACAASFEGTDLPRVVVSGNPVRATTVALLTSDDRAAARAAARAALGVPEGRRLLVVMGGSLGARRLNDALVGALAVWADRTDLAVHHVAGPREHDAVAARVPELPAGGLWYRLLPYDDALARALVAADLAVARAGASSVAELALAGLPAVLVPLPIAPRDAQGANARAVERAGGGVLVRDDELTADRLVALVDELFADPPRLASMRASLASLARPGAARDVAELVEGAVGG